MTIPVFILTRVYCSMKSLFIYLEYKVKKEKVEKRLKEKEDDLSQVKQELSELKRFQDLKIEQENEIKKLEADLEEMRFKHAKRTRDLKSKFLKDKEKFR